LYVEKYKHEEEENFWEYIFEVKISQSKFQIFVATLGGESSYEMVHKSFGNSKCHIK
jgi:hypothetical protein